METVEKIAKVKTGRNGPHGDVPTRAGDDRVRHPRRQVAGAAGRRLAVATACAHAGGSPIPCCGSEPGGGAVRLGHAPGRRAARTRPRASSSASMRALAAGTRAARRRSAEPRRRCSCWATCSNTGSATTISPRSRRPCRARLAAFAGAGGRVFLMHGNRDFLIDAPLPSQPAIPAFTARCGATLAAGSLASSRSRAGASASATATPCAPTTPATSNGGPVPLDGLAAAVPGAAG